MAFIETILKALPEILRALPNLVTGRCKRYRHFFEDGFRPAIITDMEGRIVAANRAFCEALGYAKAELEGKRFMHFVYPPDQDKTIDRMNILRDGGIVEDFPNRYLNSKRQIVAFMWEAWPVNGHGEVHATARIVTGNKRSKRPAKPTQ